MATTAERLGIVETKVENLNEKLDNIQEDVKGSHGEIKEQLRTMYDASCTQHAQLATKIQELEGFKLKWTYLIAGGVAVLGIIIGHIDKLKTIF
jgi:hypothetical protein